MDCLVDLYLAVKAGHIFLCRGTSCGVWKALFLAWTCVIIPSVIIPSAIIPNAIIVWILQGNDPGKFELIVKIQSLQKRLIVKTQGLEERELLLQVYSSSRSGARRQLTSQLLYR